MQHLYDTPSDLLQDLVPESSSELQRLSYDATIHEAQWTTIAGDKDEKGKILME